MPTGTPARRFRKPVVSSGSCSWIGSRCVSLSLRSVSAHRHGGHVFDPVHHIDDGDGTWQTRVARRRAARRTKRGALFGSVAILAFAALGLLLTGVLGTAHQARFVGDPNSST